jgi:hypothetical protein
MYNFNVKAESQTWRSAMKFPHFFFFFANIPVYLQLIERDHLQSTSYGQPCTSPNEADITGNIFGASIVEQLSAPSLFFFFLDVSVSWNLRPVKTIYFWKQLQVIRSQMRGTGWVLHYSNRFLD